MIDRQGKEVHAQTDAGLDGQTDIFQYRQVGKEVGELKGPADALFGAPGRRQPGDILAKQQHLAGAGLDLTGNEIEIGGLAGAVRADNGGKGPAMKPATDRVHRHMAAKANRQVLGLQNRSFLIQRGPCRLCCQVMHFVHLSKAENHCHARTARHTARAGDSLPDNRQPDR